MDATMAGLGQTDSLPNLDGPFRPNRALDQAVRLAECTAPDNLVWQDDHLLFTSGNAVLLLDGLHERGREAEQILRFENSVTAMAAAKDGSLAVGLGTDGIAIVGGEHDGAVIPTIGDDIGSVPTALCFADRHTLFACIGPGEESAPRSEGALWRIDLRGAAPLCLAEGLRSPAGLLLRNLDTLLVAESARCRLVECSTVAARPPRVVLDDLPGHPGRLAWGSGNTIWLAITALREERVAAGPYGLVIRLGAGLAPRASLHGRSEGRSRGVTSCLETRGELIVTCSADDALLSVDLVHPSEN
jgi:hypothetical protein